MCPTPMQQLLIVLGVLALLPAAAGSWPGLGCSPWRCTWSAPGCFFPAWAAAHQGLCIALFVLAILLAVGRWLLPVLQNRMLERQVAGQNPYGPGLWPGGRPVYAEGLRGWRVLRPGSKGIRGKAAGTWPAALL